MDDVRDGMVSIHVQVLPPARGLDRVGHLALYWHISVSLEICPSSIILRIRGIGSTLFQGSASFWDADTMLANVLVQEMRTTSMTTPHVHHKMYT